MYHWYQHAGKNAEGMSLHQTKWKSGRRNLVPIIHQGFACRVVNEGIGFGANFIRTCGMTIQKAAWWQNNSEI